MINLEWVRHGSGPHKLFSASTDLKDGAGHVLVTAYPVQRPDGEWSIMVINKDPSNPHTVRLVFDDETDRHNALSGPVTMTTFGSEQYVWRSEGPQSHPDPNLPPVNITLQAGPGLTLTLPKASISVLRGNIESARR
jgi:hypothetical protein